MNAPTRMVSVENTHNMGGGLVWDQNTVRDVVACARELGLATHLDGARLWNAAVTTGLPESALAQGFDTISVCLSKGLGAPVGSLLCGSRALMHRAHRVRKMLGGGMRQAGILAAAGLHAIEHHRARLADDHANAAFLAAELARVPGLVIDRSSVHTNIVMVDIADDAPEAARDAHALVGRAAERGLLFHGLSPRRMRLVTHLDVDRAACTRAVEIVAALMAPADARRAAHG
jgi:threonine aldolase